ncbi:hypothetical protein F5Y17DRAFT_318328 [Xylariaceae sp. FL0594]|nr:hypothetical protein F5Y17DRAFT_318328 [Xylariaceae sp. FL0594]
MLRYIRQNEHEGGEGKAHPSCFITYIYIYILASPYLGLTLHVWVTLHRIPAMRYDGCCIQSFFSPFLRFLPCQRERERFWTATSFLIPISASTPGRPTGDVLAFCFIFYLCCAVCEIPFAPFFFFFFFFSFWPGLSAEWKEMCFGCLS